MATSAKKGYGSVVEYSDDASPPLWTSVPEVISVSPLAEPRNLLNVTNLDSPNSAEEFITALKTGSDIQISCNETFATAQTTLVTRAKAGETVTFRIRYTQFTPTKTRTFALAMKDAAPQELTPGGAMALQFVGTLSGGIVLS